MMFIVYIYNYQINQEKHAQLMNILWNYLIIVCLTDLWLKNDVLMLKVLFVNISNEMAAIYHYWEMDFKVNLCEEIFANTTHYDKVYIIPR